MQCRFEGRGGLPAFATRTAGQSMERSAGGVRVPTLPHEEVPACSPQRGSVVGHLCVHHPSEGGRGAKGGEICAIVEWASMEDMVGNDDDDTV